MTRQLQFHAAAAVLAISTLAGCGESEYAAEFPADARFADTVLLNGAIYTMNPEQPWTSAVAISAGRYSQLGNDNEIRSVTGPDTDVIDLQGRMAMPGINDTHAHPWQGGIKLLYECSFPFTASPAEIAATLSDCVAAAGEREWITGGQWTSDFFINNTIDSPRAWLDRIAPDKAIVLEDDATHNVWVNSKALQLAGIGPETPDPAGGTFLRDNQGRPNGIALEAATHAFSSAMPPWTQAQYVAAISAAVQHANSYGITGMNEARTPPEVMPAYQQLDQDGRLTAHTITDLQTPRGQRREPFDVAELAALSDAYPSAHVHTRFAKLFLDGVPTSARSAVMLEPYLPDTAEQLPMNGTLLIDADTLTKDLLALDRNGFTVKTHVAGDGAVRVALDALEQVRAINGASDLRHELAHAGFINPDDLPRFAKLNVCADLSPYLWYPRPINDSIRGAVGERAQNYWPIRELLESGANVSAGSDWPSVAESMNPWPAMEAMVTRKNPFTPGDDALWPEQSVTLEQALRIFTLAGARAFRLEDTTGSVQVGKSADLIVLDQNLFEVAIEAVSDTTVVMTLFEGRVVYQAEP